MRARVARRWGDVLGWPGSSWFRVRYLSPALWDGCSFGPTDIANQLSFLTYVPHLAVHNGLNGDIITQYVPWNTLDWTAVHHGQLPLWNNYAGDGMPLLLNFESARWPCPALVGYSSRWPASFLVGIAASLLVAGTGTYAAARLAGVGPLGATLAGTTFMLSGSLSGWAGWAVGGPLTWAGWLLAGALLCHRPGPPALGRGRGPVGVQWFRRLRGLSRKPAVPRRRRWHHRAGRRAPERVQTRFGPERSVVPARRAGRWSGFVCSPVATGPRHPQTVVSGH